MRGSCGDQRVLVGIFFNAYQYVINVNHDFRPCFFIVQVPDA